MKVTDRTRRVLQSRRDRRDMKKAGFKLAFNVTDDMHFGSDWRHRIEAAEVSKDGERLWVKLAPKQEGKD